MKIQLNLEYVAFLVLGIVAFAHTEYSWWWFAGFSLLLTFPCWVIRLTTK
jgi:hypothetical protein